MRLGIIDLGTNSVRFDIHQLGPGKRRKRLHREKLMVRLGQGVFLQGRLDPVAVQRTLQAFQHFKRVADRMGASKVVAFGTSALREVGDRDLLLTAIREQTGIHVRVISGEEEARLIALGILSQERVGKKTIALVDVGGGSTEISISREKKILKAASFPVGTARIQQLFLKTSPPSAAAMAEARRAIRNELYQVLLPGQWPSVPEVIGSSGTVRALARVLSKKGKKGQFTREQLSVLVRRMCRMSTTELLALPRIEAKRVDMILAGAIVVEECLTALEARRLRVTEYSLRDGIVHEEWLLHHKKSVTHLSLHLEDLISKAKSFGVDEEQLRRTLKIGDHLFDRLRKIHGLKDYWKAYLSAAIILRDTGEAVQLNKHPLHSYYIVKNGDLPAMEDWEIEFVARLCLRHEGTKPDTSGFRFFKNKARQDAFNRVLALLRVVDALDSGAAGEIKIHSVRVTRAMISLVVGGDALTGLEPVNAERKSSLFSALFKKTLRVNLKGQKSPESPS